MKIVFEIPYPPTKAGRTAWSKLYGLIAQRPLRPNTLRRAIRCVEKFVIQSDEPFLVAGNQGITTASLIQYHSEQGEGVRGQEISRPLLTIDAAPRYGLVAATLMKYYGGDHHGQQIREPLHTITTKDRAGLLEASLQKVGRGEVQSAHLMELLAARAMPVWVEARGGALLHRRSDANYCHRGQAQGLPQNAKRGTCEAARGYDGGQGQHDVAF